jgi:putative ABC transport system permease protein
LLQDLRYGLRMLAKNPGFTAAVVITLTLGIGANTAIFTVFNSVVLRPLPLPSPDRVIRLWHSNIQGGGFGSVSYPNLQDWRAENAAFEGLASWMGGSFNLKGKGSPERIPGAFVSANYFEVMGVRPLVGRTFLPDEDKPGNNRVVVLAESTWKGAFGGDPNSIGRTVTLNEEIFAIVGVMPASFRFPVTNAQAWAPLVPDASWGAQNRGNHILQVVGRLKARVTLQQARSQMDAIASRLAKRYPDSNADQGVRLLPLQEGMVGDIRKDLLMLLVAVVFVFLIACANVVNLLLTRAAARQREIAVRMAIGAGRLRLLRQFLTETLLMVSLGAALGWGLAIGGVHLLLLLNPEDLPRLEEIRPDARVLAFTLLVALVGAVTMAAASALKAFQFNVRETLKEGGAAAAGGLRLSQARSILVVGEVAIAVLLLVGAGLLLKSLWRLQQVDAGLRPEHVLTMRLSLPQSKYSAEHPVSAFYERMLEKVEALPGVEAAGVITLLPIQESWTNGGFQIEGRPPSESGVAEVRAVSADYYRAMGVPLLRGRYFTAGDNRDSLPGVIINQEIARRYFQKEDALGRHMQIGGGPPWYTIVGVVGDVRQAGLALPPQRETDVPYSQWPPSWPDLTRDMSLVVRTRVEPAAITSAVRGAILSVDPDQPVYQVMTMDQVVSESMAGRRFDLMLLGVFASVALVLAALGTYAVLAYSTRQRTHEIGIRVALGARPADVLRLIVGEGITLAGAGVVLGLGGAYALTRFLESLLYEVKPNDPSTFVASCFVLMFAALLACYIPARRATKVDPMVALRYE